MARRIHRRLLPCKAWKQGLPMPEIVFYTEEIFEDESIKEKFEESYRTNCDVEFIGDYIPTVIRQNEVGTIAMNDKITFIVVVSGEWQLYKDADFKEEVGPILGIGFHLDIPGGVSSAKCIRC